MPVSYAHMVYVPVMLSALMSSHEMAKGPWALHCEDGTVFTIQRPLLSNIGPRMWSQPSTDLDCHSTQLSRDRHNQSGTIALSHRRVAPSARK